MPKKLKPSLGGDDRSDPSVGREGVAVLEVDALIRQLEERRGRAGEDEGAWDELLALLGIEEARRLLGRESVHEVIELVKTKRLLALPVGEGDVGIPAFQFDEDGRVYPAIERIIAIFDGVVATPYTIASWLKGPKDALGGETPLRWLELGRDPGPVIAAAEVVAARLAR